MMFSAALSGAEKQGIADFFSCRSQFGKESVKTTRTPAIQQVQQLAARFDDNRSGRRNYALYAGIPIRKAVSLIEHLVLL